MVHPDAMSENLRVNHSELDFQRSGVNCADGEDSQCSHPLLRSNVISHCDGSEIQFDIRKFPTVKPGYDWAKVDIELEEAEEGSHHCDVKLPVNKSNGKEETLLSQEHHEREEEEGEGDDGEEDPWALLDIQVNSLKKWTDMTVEEKFHRIFITFLLKPILVLVLLYFFICSLDLMSSAFRLLGGKEAGEVLGENELLNNPICGLMLGILATVLVQSSSTSTSIVVSIVSASLLSVQQAIYIIMGANIGTSVTNTIVSLAQVGKKNEFRRAFGAATVHDMFNWLVVICLLPLEVVTGYLYRVSGLLVDSLSMQSSGDVKMELLKTLTKPFTSRIVQIDKKAITRIATGEIEDSSEVTLLKVWCKKKTVYKTLNVTEQIIEDISNSTDLVTDTAPITDIQEVGVEKCKLKSHHLFVNTTMSDRAIGGILLLVALVMLCVCLIALVKILHSLMKGRIAYIIRKTLNADFPGHLGCLTGYVAILVGAGITFLVQSSSVFTSAMTPLVGMGVITLDRMYPLTLGSNIGTTATGLLAALASSEGNLKNALQIALCHLLFNVSGILIWYPLPFMRKVPIYLAKTLGNTTSNYRWFAGMYLICMFFLLPLIVFALSVVGIWLLAVVGVPFVGLHTFVVVVNVLQRKKPNFLPEKLQTWSFLPLFLRSLEPMDMLITKVFSHIHCWRKVHSIRRKKMSSVKTKSPAVVSSVDQTTKVISEL
ncbi:Sodium-dependent phosphate transport protein 2B [Holothuria leucospilota]|uniref:Sodium-dependent phosphate transport protein 2B n=1 Tax=Holothuria leucospilota TaxID=206669 RepID=A0A9Q1C1W6_HOLLE|nr:Sodium-dependent phosphate transport protein 2B [Holothuria leucospilota]